ncbi:MAG: MFS transporter [Nitrospirota bacterium]|nr:MFS transporter [Nitrospirota bacterium]MDH4359906.1 MFS transporter [Nitrospirota bacterium]MDH5296180.1 MFS transporter [Nitrospirota bacterium]
MHSLSSSPTPSRVRWRILFLLLLISIITYIDRVNISVTARQMMPALGLTDLQMGQIFSAFVFGYALFQIPGGWLGDRWGPRRVLTFAVIWWSIFTALTAVAPTLPLANLIGIMGSLMVVRFLIGIGEAAALPNFNRAVANWHPPHERGLGIGITIGGIGVGSALTPPVTAWIMVNYGWQTAFYVAGGLGIGIALLWYWYATDHPRQHPQVNNAEAELIEGSESLKDLPTPLEGRAGKAWGTVHDSFADLEKSDWLHPASRANGNGNGEKKGSTTSSPAPPRSEKQRKKTSAPIPETTVPWKVILTTPTVWWLTLSYTCLGYVAYVYMSWFYLYLVNVRGFAILQGAFFASAPFIAMAVFCPVGGWVTDRLTEKYGVNRGRASVGGAGMILAALSIIIGANVEAPFVAIGFLSLGAGWLYFTVGPFWSSTTDLSKPYAGTLSGMMNTGANLGGTLSPTLTPWLADTLGWSVSLGIAAGIALLGGLCWMFIQPGQGLKIAKPVDEV